MLKQLDIDQTMVCVTSITQQATLHGLDANATKDRAYGAEARLAIRRLGISHRLFSKAAGHIHKSDQP